MNNLPSVSVVIPSYNQAAFVREAVESVLGQDYPALEVLVMDGGSTDGSLEILRGYGDRIVLSSARDRGQADAINRGFARARGSIVAWLNSDDRYLPGAVRKAALALEARPDAAMVYGEGELIDESGALLGRFHHTQPFDLWTLIHVSDFIMQPTVFMRAACLREACGLDEDLHYGLDWDLWIRLACRWPVVYLPETLAQAREYRTTKTAQGGWRRLRELRSIMARHGATGWPPGARAYGLDTLRLRHPLVFGPSSLGERRAQRGLVLAKLFRPLHVATSWLISRQTRGVPGVWPDGWMGPRAHRALPWQGQAGMIRVRAELPEDGRLLPFTLEVGAAGRRTVVARNETGPFTAELEIPSAGGPPRPLAVTLRASRSQWHVREARWASCLLHEVSFVPCHSSR